MPSTCAPSEATIGWYRYVAGLFLAGCVNDLAEVAALSATDINAFVLGQSGRRSAGSLNNMVTSLRELLRLFYLRGYTATSLAGAAPRTVGWRDRGASRALDPRQVTRLLASCD